MWTITNKNIKSKLPEKTSHTFKLYVDENTNSPYQFNDNWLVIGYVFLRDKIYSKFKNKDLITSLEELYSAFNDNFIDYVKGNFVIIYYTEEGFKIFSDHFAVKKFFIYKAGKEFIITDDLKEISDNVKVEPSVEAMIIYALTYHFTGGTTLFKNITHNNPAEIIDFNGKTLQKSKYWEPEQLLEQEPKNVQIRGISKALANAVEQGVEITGEENISLSLTGGADTRNLLAVFLSKNITPHLYTYGNPESADCKKASIIAKGLNLQHSIHDIKMNADTFESYAREIIRQSGGLASIHRGHRIMAVEKEKQFANRMFLGTLGGEFVKGVSEDDYIVPSIVTDNWEREEFTTELLKKYFQNKRLKEKEEFLEKAQQFVKDEPYMNGNVTFRKHNSLSYITAHLHDSQDVNLYNSVMQEVYTPFLDIDYLELLFSSGFTFDKKEVIKNKVLRKMQNPEYASRFLKHTYPPLMKFKYAGEHKPSEVLFNKYYAAAMKVLRKKTTPKYPPNFQLGDWMKEFVSKNLPLCKDYDILSQTFDLDNLITDFGNETHKQNEAYWLKYTNPIMMMYIIDEFKS